MDQKQTFSLWYVLAALVGMILVQEFFATRHTQTLTYSEFKQALVAGKLDDVVIADGIATGKLKAEGLEQILPKDKLEALQRAGGEHGFATVLVNDPGLVAQLDAAKVRYGSVRESKWLGALISWVAPALVFFGIWWFLMKRMGGGMGHGGMLEIGKSKAKVYMQTETGVTFKDVAGIDEAREELMEVVEFLKNPDRYKRLGGKIPKGVLIVGAPGTGKTLLAKAVAGEAGVPFLSLSGSEFVEMFVGVGAARVRDLFEQAAAKAPCIVFIDEIDALGKARGVGGLSGGHEEHEQTLNQLLAEMDGFDTNRGVIILAATNRPEVLDPALLRPGRFDRHIAVDRPDLNGRRQILQVHVKNVKLAPTVDLAALAARTPGFAGADLANLVNEATLRAAKSGKDAVDMQDFEEALDRIVAGLEKKNRVMNPTERKFVAYHEAGHALVAEHRKNSDRVTKVSIIPRGIAALGYTQQSPTEDRYLMRRSELLDRLDVLLGGRVAEQLVFDDVSTGAENDLQRATDLARHMVTHYGMSDALGLATYDARPAPLYLNGPTLPEPRTYSERTAEAIDGEVRRLLDEARERVSRTLSTHRAALESLASLLLEKEVVDRAMLDGLMASSAAPAQLRVAAVAQSPAEGAS
ncbi:MULTISPECIES: ATP-dependent zinc metalloprotease FtsH [Methylibium]|uniref:ATP-dependent zinc metalloprotease FtsH n=1 Tax=Methylibium TaxID=316612 RepID=UPI0003F46873|nr:MULTISPECIES: ATP-dependent zinc metalloprotease FtsH [Methylibium]EWS55367.1 ATP-dependent zinc metalloprotease FtsH 4 [Methylibium sp. T29]EWS59346.1 ATP-dependent zinc metalloprotease FtsH 4 [Methylibium sp. T29-B]MBN9203590.1 ATP-dependent zinc metalloprotease FtsH [Methylibium petroleiphilum]